MVIDAMADAVPPTQGGALPQFRPGWPVVLGVICIIYAILMGACNCSALFTAQIYDWLLELERESGEVDAVLQAQAQIIGQRVWAYISLAAAGSANCIFLLVSGIALIRYRAWSRPALIVWSLVEFVLILVHCALEISTAVKVADAFAQRDLQASIGAVWFEAIVTVAGLIVISSIFPAFLLIWFSRAKIKKQVREWT